MEITWTAEDINALCEANPMFRVMLANVALERTVRELQARVGGMEAELGKQEMEPPQEERVGDGK